MFIHTQLQADPSYGYELSNLRDTKRSKLKDAEDAKNSEVRVDLEDREDVKNEQSTEGGAKRVDSQDEYESVIVKEDQTCVTTSFAVPDITDISSIAAKAQNIHEEKQVIGWYRIGGNAEQDLNIHQALLEEFPRCDILIAGPKNDEKSAFRLQEEKFNQINMEHASQPDSSFTDLFVRLALASCPTEHAEHLNRLADFKSTDYKREFAEKMAFPQPPKATVYVPPTDGVRKIMQRTYALIEEGKFKEAENVVDQALLSHKGDTHLLCQAGFIAEKVYPEEPNLAYNAYNSSLYQNCGNLKALKLRTKIQPKVDNYLNKQLDVLNQCLLRLESIPRSDPSLHAELQSMYYHQIHNTTAIEGNTLSVKNVHDLLHFGQLPPNDERVENADEIFDMKEAMALLEEKKLKMEDFSVQKLLEIHSACVSRSKPEYAGKLRDIPVQLGVPPEIVVLPSPDAVPALVDEMVDFFRNKENLERIHPAELSAFLHFYHASIHPHGDGNGRCSRQLMNACLHGFGMPPIVIYNCAKHDYFNDLRSSSLAFKSDARSFLDYVVTRSIETAERLINISFKTEVAQPVDEIQGKF
uniref:Fido domain-containing protein n=1 Tax=Ditylenchus dipsaci TaxID=166011 RepID=A0A915D2C4_9BILA